MMMMVMMMVCMSPVVVTVFLAVYSQQLELLSFVAELGFPVVAFHSVKKRVLKLSSKHRDM